MPHKILILRYVCCQYKAKDVYELGKITNMYYMCELKTTGMQCLSISRNKNMHILLCAEGLNVVEKNE